MSRRAGVIQVLLACGCMLVGGALALVGLLTWFFFFRKPAPAGPPVLTDSGQVRALAEQILPGSDPPPGHVGFLGQAAGDFLIAFQGPAGLGKDSTLQPGQLLISMISFPAGQATRDQGEQQMRAVLKASGFKLGPGSKVLEQQEGVLHPAFGEQHFVRRTYDGSPRLLEYGMLLENSAGRTVVLKVAGPQDSFNLAAMEAYLNRLQARALGSPARPGASTPVPEASNTPLATPEVVSTPTPEPATPTPPAPEPGKSTPSRPGTPKKARR